MPELDTATPQELKAALTKSGADQAENVKLGHTFAEPFDFGGIDEPDVGEPDSGMGRFSPLTEDPEPKEGSPTEGIEVEAGVAGEAAPEPSAELQEAAERAEDYGIPASDLEGMTVKQVNRFLDRFDTHMDGVSAAAPAPAPATPAAATPAPVTVPAATPAPELKLSDDADPDMVAMAKYLTSTVGPLAKEISELKAANASQATDNITQGIDMQFDVLAQKHGKAALNLFGGEGKMRPAQRVNRANVHKAVSVLVQGHASMGGAVPSAVELFDTAVKSTLGTLYANLAAGKKAAAIGQRQTQHIQRPHSRTTAKPASGYKTAVASVAAFMRERGMTDEHVAVSDEEEFAPMA